jgi:hypothetical protein
MNPGTTPIRLFLLKAAAWLLFALVGWIALFGERPYVSSWNDASRMATVESLVDYHTLAIDDSIFTEKTYDKVKIAGHFYSEKSPVPALWQALVYLVLQLLIGLHAQGDPGRFCYLIGVASSGLAYALSVAGIQHMGRCLKLAPAHTLLLTGSFALATLAPVYVRNVNSHILLLAVACWLMVLMMPAANSPTPYPWPRAVGLGLLAGLGYTIDLGVGPVLLMGSGLYLCWKAGSFRTVVIFALAALPLVLLHQALNYAMGGTFRPVAAVPEFHAWEGSKFSPDGLTGNWVHPQLHNCIQYAILLLFGEHGFVTYQPVLWLALFAFGILLWRRVPELPLLCLAGFWCVGSWLIYTVGSNNYAGECCSIRWFVPLLAPAFFILAVTLKQVPDRWADLGVLSAWGMVLAAVAYVGGPWIAVDTWLLWVVQAGALLSWIVLRVILHLTSRQAGKANSLDRHGSVEIAPVLQEQK